MKLKTLILLNERGMSMGFGSLTANDNQKLIPLPGSVDDIENWDGIAEGDKWFSIRGMNDWINKISEASIVVHEGNKPHKFWIKIKTHGLKKSKDKNQDIQERVKKHVDRILKSWISEAKKLHTPELNEVGNLIQKKSWNECFREALENPKIKSYIKDHGESKISPTISDPVNFTPRA